MKLDKLKVLHIIFDIVLATCVAIPGLQSFQSTGPSCTAPSSAMRYLISISIGSLEANSSIFF